MTAAGAPAYALPNPDADLVARAQAGDPDAFGRIFEQQRVPIFNFLYRYTGDRHRAEDLTQDTFVKAWRKIGATRYGELKVAPWLYAIAHRVFLDSVRHEKLVQWQPWDAFLAAFHPSQVAEQTPERAALDAERAAQVRATLDRLPERYRRYLELREYHDLSYDEIARRFATTRAAVKTCLYRARALFSAEWPQVTGEPCPPIRRTNLLTFDERTFKGVSFRKEAGGRPWRAQLTHERVVHYIGSYATRQEALAARNAWLRLLHHPE